MGKRIILNLSEIKLNGDVLDVGESYGVIYNLTKEIQDELAIDYIESREAIQLIKEQYDTCTFFFCLSSILRESYRGELIRDVSKLIKVGGEILIWDINKERGNLFNNTIGALLPSGKVKEFEFKNLNPISKSNIEDIKAVVSKEYKVIEEKLYEDIFFIRAEKI